MKVCGNEEVTGEEECRDTEEDGVMRKGGYGT